MQTKITDLGGGIEYLSVDVKNDCGGTILIVHCARWGRDAREKEDNLPTWAEYLKERETFTSVMGRWFDYTYTKSAHCVSSFLRGDYTDYASVSGHPGWPIKYSHTDEEQFTGDVTVAYVGTTYREEYSDWDKHFPCFKLMENPAPWDTQ